MSERTVVRWRARRRRPVATAPSTGPGRAAVVVVVVAALLAGCGGGGGDGSAAPPDDQVEVVLGLRRQQDALADAVWSRADPSDPGRPLAMAEVAERFGASDDDLSTLRTVLGDAGVDAQVHPSGGFATVSLTVARAESLLGVDLVERTADDGTTYLGPDGTPSVPDGLDGVVTEVVGLTRSVPAGGSAPSTAVRAGPDQSGCDAARTAVSRLHDRYGLSGLLDGGVDGAGAGVAVVAVEQHDPAALDAWTTCLGRPAPQVEVTEVGTTSHTGGEHEIDLDLAVLTAALPGLDRVGVVEVDPLEWVGAPYAAALAADPVPTTISSSVGFCEMQLSAAEISLAEWVLGAAALVGTTVVVAAGDHGSSSCGDAASVQYPASSAFAVAVGGSQWTVADGEVTSVSVWVDPDAGEAGGGASSGAVDRPSYQRSLELPAGRAVPDLAAYAATDDAPPVPVCESGGTCSWESLGGTSAAAPLVAGGLVLAAEAWPADEVGPSGRWHPLLYAAGAPAIADITEGDNDLSDIGCCTAGTGYDRASGLGEPDVSALVPGRG